MIFRRFTLIDSDSAASVSRSGAIVVTDDGLGLAIAESDAVGRHRGTSSEGANPERMSAKIFQEGYEASLRKSGLPEAEISPLLRKAQRVYDELIEGDTDDVAEDEMDDVDWEKLEIL